MSKTILGIIAVAVAISLLYPFEIIVAPEWKLKVVNENGEPISNAYVREYWQHLAVEMNTHQEDFRSDEKGFVVFPERSVKFTFLRRILTFCWNILSQGHHAGFRPHVSASAWHEDKEGYIPYYQGQPAPDQIILYKRK